VFPSEIPVVLGATVVLGVRESVQFCSEIFKKEGFVILIMMLSFIISFS